MHKPQQEQQPPAQVPFTSLALNNRFSFESSGDSDGARLTDASTAVAALVTEVGSERTAAPPALLAMTDTDGINAAARSSPGAAAAAIIAAGDQNVNMQHQSNRRTVDDVGVANDADSAAGDNDSLAPLGFDGSRETSHGDDDDDDDNGGHGFAGDFAQLRYAQNQPHGQHGSFGLRRSFTNRPPAPPTLDSSPPLTNAVAPAVVPPPVGGAATDVTRANAAGEHGSQTGVSSQTAPLIASHLVRRGTGNSTGASNANNGGHSKVPPIVPTFSPTLPGRRIVAAVSSASQASIPSGPLSLSTSALNMTVSARDMNQSAAETANASGDSSGNGSTPVDGNGELPWPPLSFEWSREGSGDSMRAMPDSEARARLLPLLDLSAMPEPATVVMSNGDTTANNANDIATVGHVAALADGVGTTHTVASTAPTASNTTLTAPVGAGTLSAMVGSETPAVSTVLAPGLSALMSLMRDSTATALATNNSNANHTVTPTVNTNTVSTQASNTAGDAAASAHAAVDDPHPTSSQETHK